MKISNVALDHNLFWLSNDEKRTEIAILFILFRVSVSSECDASLPQNYDKVDYGQDTLIFLLQICSLATCSIILDAISFLGLRFLTSLRLSLQPFDARH